MPSAKSLRKEFTSYLKSMDVVFSVSSRKENIIYVGPLATQSYYFNTGVFVYFQDDGRSSSAVQLRAAENVKLISTSVRDDVMQAISQQNEMGPFEFYLGDLNGIGAWVWEQVQPGSVGDQLWGDIVFLTREMESFLFDIEDMLDPDSYKADLSSADQKALEDAVNRMFP